MEISELFSIEEIAFIAIEAGYKIMNVYRSNAFSHAIGLKADDSQLTFIQKISNEYITNELKRIANIPVLSEEEQNISYFIRKQWKRFWLIDPLDSPSEFVNRTGEFTVNIALVEDDVPVLGIIYAPALDLLYYASVEEGAFKKALNVVTPLLTNKKTQELVAIGNCLKSSPEERLILSGYPVSRFTVTESALKFGRIAEGNADIYYRHHPTMEWSTAAGQVIVECSGGKVFNEYNKPLRYNKMLLRNGSFLCVGNPDHDML